MALLRIDIYIHYFDLLVIRSKTAFVTHEQFRVRIYICKLYIPFTHIYYYLLFLSKSTVTLIKSVILHLVEHQKCHLVSCAVYRYSNENVLDVFSTFIDSSSHVDTCDCPWMFLKWEIVARAIDSNLTAVLNWQLHRRVMVLKL